MRRLVSKEEQERIRKKNQVTVGVILVFLMVASTLGFAIQSNLGSSGAGNENPSKLTYNGFEFTNTNGFWVFQNFVFRYNPEEVPDIGSGLRNIEGYRGKPVYIQSEDEVAGAEVYVNLAQVAERVQEACIEGGVCVEGLPIKTCSDNFIIIREKEASSISQVDGCVYIESQKEELVKLADQFLFKILGIK
ncbi:hypothetical protein J4422_00860 [Candidatus Pacearchaeota archaeon]|nr:hypothetical protein [uncultured archaeon]MBS3086233.1 hypothetical protein [Candidatus Pacearchaeota archaeon]